MQQRRACRVAAVQFIYMAELNPPENRAFELQRFFDEQEQPREFYAFAEELINGVLDHQAAVDAEIRALAENWDFSRIAKVDLAILRLAVYELRHRRDIPPVVTINEAIEISKLFSIDDSRRFINGILDRVKETLDRPFRTAAE